MAYRLDPGEKVKREVRRIAREQLDKALAEIDDPSIDRDEAVHQARKRTKKVRALARLVRKSFDDYSDVNAAARDAARRVADARDAKVFVDTFDALVEPHAEIIDLEAVLPIREALVTHRRRVTRAHLEDEDRLAKVREDLCALRDDAKGWALDDGGFDAVCSGLRKTYGRAKDAMDDAYDACTPEAFHEWRKRVKYHRFHVRLLVKVWEGPLDALRGELKTLSNHLGDAHDLSELEAKVEALCGDDETLAEPRYVLSALAERRRAELREAARSIGEKVFAEDADAMAERMRAVWCAT